MTYDRTNRQTKVTDYYTYIDINIYVYIYIYKCKYIQRYNMKCIQRLSQLILLKVKNGLCSIVKVSLDEFNIMLQKN